MAQNPTAEARTRLRVRAFFEPRDLWVGVFWTVDTHALNDEWRVVPQRVLRVYVCILPCFPILVTWRTPVRLEVEA